MFFKGMHLEKLLRIGYFLIDNVEIEPDINYNYTRMSYEDEYASSTIPPIKIEFKNKHIYLILLFFVATVCLFSNLWIGDLR